MNTLVELSNVTKVYDAASPQPALNGVSLRIPAGEVTAVMGPSGSGKSTLLNLVAGLDRVIDGSIRVDGLEITRLGEAALARYRRARIGLIFQFFNLLNNLTVRDNVLIPAQLAGVTRRAAEQRAGELLEQLGIADQADRYPARLSGGQRQRVAIARALVNTGSPSRAGAGRGCRGRSCSRGLVAGGLGIPIGLVLHREILQSMGQIATGTAIPPSFFDLIDHAVLPLLALAGVAIAAIGAWVPARWAASSGVAEVLQAE